MRVGEEDEGVRVRDVKLRLGCEGEEHEGGCEGEEHEGEWYEGDGCKSEGCECEGCESGDIAERGAVGG